MKKLLAVILSLALVLSFMPAAMAEDAETAEPIKILAIGNSYTFDTMKWVYQVADDLGVKVELAMAYHASWGLYDHLDAGMNDKPEYNYQQNTEGSWVNTPNQTLRDIIKDKDWDIITLQHQSAQSGVTDSYEPDLTELVKFVEENKTNPDAKLGWIMTWAYPETSKSESFPMFANSQMLMYNSIVEAVKTNIVENEAFDFIVPSGTAVQNVRTSFIGDNLTRDDIHLSLARGRYISALTYFAAATGNTIDAVKYVPADASDVEITPDMLEAIKEGVNNAIAKPFEVTVSKTAPEGYELPWCAVDVSEMGSYDENTGIFTFTDSGVVCYNATDKAYYPDRALDLGGKACAYLNGKFYVPGELVDYISGAAEEKLNPYTTIEAYVDTIVTNPKTPYAKAGELTVKNLLPEADVSGKLIFTAPEGYAALGEIPFGSIKAGDSLTMTFSIGETPVDKAELDWKVILDNGLEYEGKAIRHYMYAGKNDGKIKIDGVIEEGEWNTVPLDVTTYAGYAAYGGEEDFSVKTMVMHDEKGIYFASEIKDNAFFQTQTPVNFWNGDSIQIALYNDEKTYNMKKGVTDSGVTSYNVAISGGKVVIYRDRAQGGVLPVEVIEGAEAAYTQNGNITTYEFMLTWEQAFGEKLRGNYFGIAYLFNDGDTDAGRTGYGQVGANYFDAKDHYTLFLADFNKDDVIKIMLNGEEVVCDQPPVIVNDRTLVPMRAIFEALGAEVDWAGETQTVTAKSGDTEISLKIGENVIYIGERAVELDTAAQLISDRTMVPVRAVSEALGCTVDWVDTTRTVVITK